jgi:hypothetical protein
MVLVLRKALLFSILSFLLVLPAEGRYEFSVYDHKTGKLLGSIISSKAFDAAWSTDKLPMEIDEEYQLFISALENWAKEQGFYGSDFAEELHRLIPENEYIALLDKYFFAEGLFDPSGWMISIRTNSEITRIELDRDDKTLYIFISGGKNSNGFLHLFVNKRLVEPKARVYLDNNQVIGYTLENAHTEISIKGHSLTIGHPELYLISVFYSHSTLVDNRSRTETTAANTLDLGRCKYLSRYCYHYLASSEP